MKTGELVELNVKDIGASGEGIAAHDGFTVFIPYALKGEKITARINYIKKNLAYADLIKVLIPSENRVTPVCPLFTRCGGCDYMHVSYPAQLESKRQNLSNILRKNAGITAEPLPVEPSQPLYYRNKIQLPFGIKNGRIVLGFFEEKTHTVVPLQKCYLHGEWADILIKTVLSFVEETKQSVYDEKTGKGLLRHLVARYIGNALNVTLVINGNSVKGIQALAESLKEKFPSVSLYLNVNRNRNNVIMGTELIPVLPTPQSVNIMGVDIAVNPMSFFQINDEIRDKIYQKTVDLIQPDHNTVVIDAYSGVGLLGAVMAKSGAYIYNIEIVPEAIRDADALYNKNGLDGHFTNICGDSAVELPRLIASPAFRARITSSTRLFIVLDPPRKGLDASLPAVIEALAKDIPFSMIYISCNPATLSRDLALLPSFTPTLIAPYDMFPNTSHVETLVCLIKKS